MGDDVSRSVPKGDDLLNMGGNAKEESQSEEDDMFGGMDVGQAKKTNTGNVDLSNMNEALPPSKPVVQSRNSDDIMDLMGDITGSVPQNNGNIDNGSSAFGFDLGGGGDSTAANTQQNGMSETTVVEDQKRKKSEYAYLDVLANDANVSQQNTTTSNDILNMMSNPTAQANNSQAQTAENSGSAFGFDLGGNTNANVQPAAQNANGGGGSAFGFDLGGNAGASNQTNQSNLSSMNSSVIMNKNSGSPLLQSMGTGNANNMMTPQMMQQNNQMGAMLNNNMAQMNQMQAMMQQMQAMNMNPMQMQMMMQQMQQNTMTNNQQQQQQQAPQQQYGMTRNDPFANIGRSNQSQQAVPK